MSDVEFNEPSFESMPRPQTIKEPSRLSKLVISTGLATDEKSAQMVLLVAGVVCLVVAGLVYFLSSPGTPEAPPVTAPLTP